jgi:hypothetical protein
MHRTVRRKPGEAKMDVVAVAQKFCAGWTSLDAEAVSLLFAPEGYSTDIAFGITRRRRDQVREHHRIWRTAVPEFVMLKEQAYEAGSTVIVKTLCYGTFSGGGLGGGKLKATFKSFRARAISVLELNEQSQILACTEYYDRSTMPNRGGPMHPSDRLSDRTRRRGRRAARNHRETLHRYSELANVNRLPLVDAGISPVIRERDEAV